MKKCKQILLSASIAFMVSALTGCGGGSAANSPQSNATSNASSTSTTSVTDTPIIPTPTAPLVNQADLTAVVAPNIIYAGQSATLSSIGGSGTGAVAFSVTDGSCIISGATLVASSSAGTCVVSATKAADNQYLEVTAAPVTVTVNSVDNTITFSAPSAPTVGGDSVSLTATASSNLPITYTSTTPSICTVSGSTLTPVNDGVCWVTASQAGDSVFPAANSVSISFVVNGALQAISFPAPTALAIGATQTLTATASSGLPITYVASPASVCTVSGSTLTGVGTGSCTVTASQVGDNVYAAAGSQTQTVAVSVGQLIFSAGYNWTTQAMPSITQSGGAYGPYGSVDSNTTAYLGSGNAGTDAASASTYVYLQVHTPNPATIFETVGMYVQAPGLTTGISTTGNTPGLTINGQTTMTASFGPNPEWANQTDANGGHNALVQLTLGNHYVVNGVSCNVTLQKIFTPVLNNSTPFTFNLADFTIGQNCGLTSLVTAFDALAPTAGGPISQIDFMAAFGTKAVTIGGLTTSANTSIILAGNYPTAFGLSGPITFQ